MRTHCHAALHSPQFDKCIWAESYTEPIVVIVPWGCVLSFQAEEVESMHGNYFSLGISVQRNPTAPFADVCQLAYPHSRSSQPCFMQLWGQFTAPAGEQFAIEGLFSGPWLNRFPGDGDTEWLERTCKTKCMVLPPCATQEKAARLILAPMKSVVTDFKGGL